MSKNRYSISPSVHCHHCTQSGLSLVFIANILIFLLIGLIIADKLFFTQGVGWQDVGCVLLLYVVLHVVRFLTIVAFLPLFNRTSMQLSWSEVLMVSWSGVRGGMSLLLAITTYLQPGLRHLDYRSRLTFLVSGVALLTLSHQLYERSVCAQVAEDWTEARTSRAWYCRAHCCTCEKRRRK